MGTRETFFYLYGIAVYAYTDHQTLQPLIKPSRAYRQDSARLTRRRHGLAHFDIAIKHTARNNLALTDYLCRHPIKKTKTDGIHEEDYVTNMLSKLFILHHKYGQLLKTDRKSLSIDESTNMTLKTNRELTNESASPKKLIPDLDSKNLRSNKHKQSIQLTQNSISLKKLKFLILQI